MPVSCHSCTLWLVSCQAQRMKVCSSKAFLFLSPWSVALLGQSPYFQSCGQGKEIWCLVFCWEFSNRHGHGFLPLNGQQLVRQQTWFGLRVLATGHKRRKGKGCFAGRAEYWTEEHWGCFGSLLSVVSCINRHEIDKVRHWLNNFVGVFYKLVWTKVVQLVR